MSGLLFSEECPVSEQEVKDWLDKIPTLSATESRRQTYRITQKRNANKVKDNSLK